MGLGPAEGWAPARLGLETVTIETLARSGGAVRRGGEDQEGRREIR